MLDVTHRHVDVETEFDLVQWRAEGGNGVTAPGIQGVKLQKLKCCN